MTRITGDDFMLIGLHKMAAERGDGLIPEMIDVLRRSGEALTEGAGRSVGLIEFPMRRDEPASEIAPPASHQNNVITFPIARRLMTRR